MQVNVRYFATTHQISYDIARTTAEIDRAFGGNIPIAPTTKFIIDRAVGF